MRTSGPAALLARTAGAAFLSLAATVLGAASAFAAQFAYIANHGSNRVETFSINPSTGALSLATAVIAGSGVSGTTFVSIDPAARFAYVTLPAFVNSIGIFGINTSSGQLSPLGSQSPDPGIWTTDLAVVDPSGRFVYVVYQTGGPFSATAAAIRTFAIDQSTGLLTAGTALSTPMGVKSFAVHPTGKFAYMTNRTLNTITGYTIDRATGAFTASAPVDTGSRPVMVALDPTGRFAYVVNDSSNNVSTYAIDPVTGALTVGATAAAGSVPFRVAAHPSGKFLYVANQQSNNVSVYTINQVTGALIAGTTVAAGSSPQSMAAEPTGKFVYVTNQSASNNVWVYTVNPATGALTAGTPVSATTSPWSIATTPLLPLATPLAIPASLLAFAPQLAGSTSPAQSFTITNTTAAPIAVAEISASGPYPASSNCGATLAAAATCTVTVSFTPARIGAVAGAVSIVSSLPGNEPLRLNTVVLSGTGLQSVVTLTGPFGQTSANGDTLLFLGATNVGSASVNSAVTLKNTGTAAMSIAGISATPPFSQVNSCGITLAINASCTVFVTFTPVVSGAATGTLSVTSNSSVNPATMNLSGTGQPAPVFALSLSTQNLAFGDQPVNTTSPGRLIIMTNGGNQPLNLSLGHTFSNVAASGPYQVTNACPATLAVGAECSKLVSFRPSAAGPSSNTLLIYANLANGTIGTYPVAVSGNGIAAGPGITLSAVSLAFATQLIGSSSAAQTFTVTNSGTQSLVITGIVAVTPFSRTTTCGSSLAPGASCTVSVTFSPTASGVANGNLTITSNALSSPTIVSLTGAGSSTPAVTVSPGAFAFGSQQVGTTSGTQAVTVTSAGGASLTIGSVSVSGMFAQTNNCPASLASGATCTVSVSFAPTASGATAGTLSIASNAPNSPATVPLSGIGGGSPIVTFLAAGLDFGNATLGDANGKPSVITINNTGTATLNISSIVGSAEFTPGTTTCGTQLLVGATCTINVVFRPAAIGPRTGMLTITDAVNVKSFTANLTGTGVAGAAIVRLVNIATRMQVLTGENVMIGGFIIGGSAPKTVVVRARGPSLTALGVPGALANPVLQLFTGQTQIGLNDNFADASNAAALQASGFAPSNSLESAILTTLAPGAYTAIVSGAGGSTGVGIIEVFEVDLPEVPLVNIATRGQVLTGSDVMIGGFIIQGNGPQTVVVRARGPSMAAAGVANPLANPVLQLFTGQTQIAINDNWETAANAAELLASGFAPSNSLESAILITLNPGAYTAIVTGANGGTGVGIVEVFAR